MHSYNSFYLNNGKKLFSINIYQFAQLLEGPIKINLYFFIFSSWCKHLFMIWCSDRKKKYFFISKVWKMTKKCLKMMFFPIKNQKFAGACRWVSYIPECALNYDWLHGKGLILRTLENSSWGGGKTWKNGEKRGKRKKYVHARIRTHTQWKAHI